MAPEPSRRSLIATGAAVAGSAALAGPLSSTATAAASPAAKTKPTIVLAHGGFADASC